MFVVAMQTLQTVKRHSTFYLFIFVKFNNLFAKSNNFKLPLFFFFTLMGLTLIQYKIYLKNNCKVIVHSPVHSLFSTLNVKNCIK